MTPTVFLKWRNRAVAQLSSGINGTIEDIPLVTGQGARLTQVLTASGDKVRAQIIERDPTSGEVIACELVDITNNVSDILKVTRGVEETRATDDTNTYSAAGKIFSSAAYIEEVISSEVISELQDAINAVEDEKVDKTEYDADKIVLFASSAGDDDYEITSADITTYTDGRTFKVRADVANTGAATLKLNALAAKPIEKLSGWAFAALSTGDIIANQIFWVTYNLAEDCFQFSVDPATVLTGTTPRAFELHNALFPLHAGSEAYETSVGFPRATAEFATATSVALWWYLNGVKVDASGAGRLDIPLLWNGDSLKFNSGKNIVITMALDFPPDGESLYGFWFSGSGFANWDTSVATTPRFGYRIGSGPSVKACSADGTTYAESTDLDSFFGHSKAIHQIFWDATTNMAYYYINGVQRAAISTTNLASSSADIYFNIAYGGTNAFMFISEFMISIEK